MKNILLAAALIASLAGGAAAEAPVKTKSPAQAVASALEFKAPKGWKRDAYASPAGADPAVRFERLADAIQVRVLGGPDSDFPTVAAYLSEPPPASPGGEAEAAGRKLPAYTRRFALDRPAPHSAAAAKGPKGIELFCILPLSGGRFAVVSYRRSAPGPDLSGGGEKAWRVFLKSVKPK